jgi:hypothetical protein
MDFTALQLTRVQKHVKERYIRDVKHLQERLQLPIDKFEHEYFTNNNNLPTITAVLDNQKIGDARKADYLRSVCALLSDMYITHPGLKQVLSGYSKQARKKERIILDRTPLKTLLADSKTSPLIKVLCGILIYNVPVDLSTMIKSTINDPTSCYNYNTETHTWMVNTVEHVVNKEFTDLVSKISSNNFTHANLTTISRLFKAATGHTFTEYSYTEKQRTVTNEEIHEVKTSSFTEECYEWGSLLNNNVVAIHIQNIKHMSEKLGETSDYFDAPYYNNPETLFVIRSMTDMSINTKHNIVTALCVVLDVTAGQLYNEYTIYRMELELELAKSNIERKVPWFPNMYQKMYDIYKNSAASKAVRVICMMVVCNITDPVTMHVDIETELGVLRPSDLISCRISDKCEGSYVDLKHKTMLIHKDYTKNKQERMLKLSDNFIEGIREIYGERLPEYLVVTEDGSKYGSSISNTILDTVGVNFDIIRASYFTWREATVKTKREILKTLCWKQGHQYSTAMMNYKRIIDYSI